MKIIYFSFILLFVLGDNLDEDYDFFDDVKGSVL